MLTALGLRVENGLGRLKSHGHGGARLDWSARCASWSKSGVPDVHPGPSQKFRVNLEVSDVTWKQGSVRFTLVDPFMCAETGLVERLDMAHSEPIHYR